MKNNWENNPLLGVVYVVWPNGLNEKILALLRNLEKNATVQTVFVIH